MNPDDVRMVAGIAASLVAAIGVVGLAFLGAYLIATDHRRPEESMRQHQRAMRSLGEAHQNVRSSGPARPLPGLRTPLGPARRATSGTGRTSGREAAPSRRGHRRNRS